jgi:hypothetical protein
VAEINDVAPAGKLVLALQEAFDAHQVRIEFGMAMTLSDGTWHHQATLYTRSAPGGRWVKHKPSIITSQHDSRLDLLEALTETLREGR